MMYQRGMNAFNECNPSGIGLRGMTVPPELSTVLQKDAKATSK